MSSNPSNEEEEDNSNSYICKVILVGESGVGKTSIISRYIYDEFKITEQVTLGASCSEKRINLEDGFLLKLYIWDTIGQENYRALNKMFYKNAIFVILVYDITNARSFEQIKTFWYEHTKQNVDEEASKFLY